MSDHPHGLTAAELAARLVSKEAQYQIEVLSAQLRAVESRLRAMEPDVRAALIARCERVASEASPLARLAEMARAV